MGVLETVLIVIIFISVTALIYLAVLSNNSKLEKEKFSFLTDRLSIATGIYQVIEDIDVINDYILPYSNEKELIGLPNDSYILIADDKISYYGNIYKIHNGKSTKSC